MQDFQARFEKLQNEAAECDRIASRATDIQKRQLFEKLAHDYREMAEGVRKIIEIQSG